MRRTVLSLAACAAAFVAVPASATVLISGSSGVAPTPGVPAGQGTLLASQSFSGQAFTFSAIFNQAVYRNSAGTLDFYFQVLRTGAGSLRDEEIRMFTVSNFASYLVDGYASAADPDGGGLFVAANNPALANGTPSGSTTTFARSPDGIVLSANFGLNGLTGTENSATYVFRTNATTFNNLGTFGIIDGSTLSGTTFQPTGLAVPEPAAWAMMILGLGMVGASLRYRRRSTKVVFG